MKQIIALVLLATWMVVVVLMAGEPVMNEWYESSPPEPSPWIGYLFLVFVFGTPFLVMKLIGNKTK